MGGWEEKEKPRMARPDCRIKKRQINRPGVQKSIISFLENKCKSNFVICFLFIITVPTHRYYFFLALTLRLVIVNFILQEQSVTF